MTAFAFEFNWLAQRIAMCVGDHACPPSHLVGPRFKTKDGTCQISVDMGVCVECWKEAAHNAAKEAEIQYNEPSRSSI